jgi:hypothetical protein
LINPKTDKAVMLLPLPGEVPKGDLHEAIRAFLAQRGGAWVDENGDPAFNSPAAVETLALLPRSIPIRPVR